jgi:hypothetical protein
MILKDSNILDDDDDILESVSMAESSRRNKPVNKGYNAMDSEQGMLAQYDEEVSGVEGFVIGEKGRVEGRRQEISEALKGESLEVKREGIVDYYTKEDVVFKKMKKSKKKKSGRTRVVEPEEEQETSTIDRMHGDDAPPSPPERERNFESSNSTRNIDEV